MRINKGINLIDFFGDKSAVKTKISERTKKTKSDDRTKSSNDTLIQLSDYLNLKTKPAKLASEKYTPISDNDQAQIALDEAKSQSTDKPKEFILTQASSNSLDVIYLLD